MPAALVLVGGLGCQVYDPGLLERRDHPQAVLGEPGAQRDAGLDTAPAGADGGKTLSNAGSVYQARGPEPPSMCDGGDACQDVVPNCDAGGCGEMVCGGDHLDCDDRPDNGCEVDSSRDPRHCGSCDNDCTALSNATETGCATGGACEIVTCEAGFASCDGDSLTGCETSISTMDNCGGCASKAASQVCDGLPHTMTSTCATASCEIESCASGWANCDGQVDNGCEHDVGALGPCTPSVKRLVVDPAFVDAPLADFPMLVRLAGDADLMTARADGGDIFFSTDGGPAQGDTALAFELASWNRAGGELVAWVRLPAVSDTDETVFFMRYGDGIDYSAGNEHTDVWDAEFESVHHFDEGMAESTNHPISATNANSTFDPGGRIAGARGLGDNAFISMSPGVLPDADDYTISVWVKATLAGGNTVKYVMNTSGATSPYSGMALGVHRDSGALTAFVGGVFRTSTRDFVSDGVWHFVAARYHVSGSEGRFETSLDGSPFEVVFAGDTEDTRTVSTSPFEVGRWAGGLYHFDGSIDELRVSSTARSDAWVRAAYENQREGSNFVREDQDN